MRPKQVRLKSRPDGIPQSENFEIVEVELPKHETGKLLIRNMYLSIEPAMRGWVSGVGNYSDPVALGSTMRSLAVGRVIASDTPGFCEGDLVVGWFGWQDYALVSPDAVIRKVLEHDLPASLALGVLGLTGLTAYFALTKIGKPQQGDVVVVSTAAGSVGSAAGQIARIFGAQTIGITGSAAKVRACVDSFGYDAAIDYKSEDVGQRLAELCPSGVNVYFDNTAGKISDTVLSHICIGARVIVCGTASVASWAPPPQGPRVERQLLTRRALMQGFLLFDHMAEYEAAVVQLADWVREGRVRYIEDILDGIDCCPDSIAALYRGENLGKRMIRLASDDTA